MPDETPRLQIPIPTGDEASDIPAALMDAFTAMEQAGVPRVRTTPERDARFNGDDPGALVITQEPPALWLRTELGWSQVYGDTGWKNVSLLNGWTSPGPLQYRIKNGICHWRSVIVPPESYTAREVAVVCNVPAEARPPTRRRWTISSNSAVWGTLELVGGEMQVWLEQDSIAWFGVPDAYPVD